MEIGRVGLEGFGVGEDSAAKAGTEEGNIVILLIKSVYWVNSFDALRL